MVQMVCVDHTHLGLKGGCSVVFNMQLFADFTWKPYETTEQNFFSKSGVVINSELYLLRIDQFSSQAWFSWH